jgi:FdhE protein
MSNVGDLQPDPNIIGHIAKPPFVLLADPSKIFTKRAERLRSLATRHQLEPYLRFLADPIDAQLRILPQLPEPDMPAADVAARAKEHAMPPLDRNGFRADAAFDAPLELLLSLVTALQMPPSARKDALVPAGDDACPACGAPPVSNVIVGWPRAAGRRFCSCSLCGTLWNFVRARCTVCGSTDKITFQEIDGSAGQIKAEICGACRSYVKILYQHKNPALDPAADDVASLGLDLLVRETGYRRGGVNPFLIGY